MLVAITIDKGWHIYAANPEIDVIVPTTITTEVKAPIEIKASHRSSASTLQDSVLKKEIKAYKNSFEQYFEIDIPQETNAGAYPVNITVKTQACDKEACQLPQTTHFRFNLEIK